MCCDLNCARTKKSLRLLEAERNLCQMNCFGSEAAKHASSQQTHNIVPIFVDSGETLVDQYIAQIL